MQVFIKFFFTPCGIRDKAVPSMLIELGNEVNMDEVKDKVKKHLSVLFGFITEEV